MACQRCLQDDFLRRKAIELGTLRKCPVCRSRNAKVLDDALIAPYIQNLVQAYRPVDASYSFTSGDHIADLLQEDWGIFTDPIADEKPRLREALVRLLYWGVDLGDDHPDYECDWAKASHYLETIWHEGCVALLQTGKPLDFDFDKPDFPDVMELAFEDLMIELPAGSHFFRGRIHDDRYRLEPFGEDELFAPPPEKASSARASKKGEPVLYVSDTKETCVAEVRPWNTAAVAIAAMRTTRSTRIVDLSEKRIVRNPFTDELLKWRMQLSELLQRVSYELSLPVSPNHVDRDYLITQDLCRLIKEARYDGVKYQSSVSEGFNIAFFDTHVAAVENIEYVTTNAIKYETTPITGGPIYEATPYDDVFGNQKEGI